MLITTMRPRHVVLRVQGQESKGLESPAQGWGEMGLQGGEARRGSWLQVVPDSCPQVCITDSSFFISQVDLLFLKIIHC